MQKIHLPELKIAFSQLAFILMLSLPLLTFPSDSIYPRYYPDMMAFAFMGLWGLLTFADKQTRTQSLEINSLGLLAIAWACIVIAQHVCGLISTYVSFTLLSLGYLFAMVAIGSLVNVWIKAGYKQELVYSLLLSILVVALVNAIVVLIQASSYSELFAPLIEPGNSQRPGGFISQSNIAGSWFVCGLVGLIFLTRQTEQKSTRPSVLHLCLMVLLMLGINLTASRIVLLEILALSTVLFLFRKQFNISIIWLLIPLWQSSIHLLTYLGNKYLDWSVPSGTFSRLNESQQTRYDIYNGAIEMIKDQPIWGIGWRQMQLEQFSGMDLKNGILDHAHNVMLQIQLELGILGSLALMLFFIYWIRQKYIWQTNDPAVVVGLCVTMVFGLHSLTEFPLWYGPSLFLFSTSVALISDKPLMRLKLNTPLVISLFLLQLSILVWIYFDHAKAYKKLEDFSLHASVSQTTETMPSWWFKTYDDYRELQTITLTPDNYKQYQAQILQLTNFFTPAIPYHLLLQQYVFSKDEKRSLGLARNICHQNPLIWQKMMTYHLLEGPQEMRNWILGLPADLRKCVNSENDH